MQWFFDFTQYNMSGGHEYYNEYSWRLLWHLVATEMKSLETLKLRLLCCSRYEWSEELAIDAPWITPLRKVKGLEDVKF